MTCNKYIIIIVIIIIIIIINIIIIVINYLWIPVFCVLIYSVYCQELYESISSEKTQTMLISKVIVPIKYQKFAICTKNVWMAEDNTAPLLK